MQYQPIGTHVRASSTVRRTYARSMGCRNIEPCRLQSGQGGPWIGIPARVYQGDYERKCVDWPIDLP
jgi:hypothetical protein